MELSRFDLRKIWVHTYEDGKSHFLELKGNKMEHLTWKEVREILIKCGDSEALDEAVELRNSDGAFPLDLVVDARSGNLSFIDAVTSGE